MSGHTPGPWEDSGCDTFRVLAKFSNGYFWEIANAAPVSFISDEDGSVITAGGDRGANARLIAAAPELLDALEQAERALGVHCFTPVGHSTQREKDTCAVCGFSFRSEYHLRGNEKDAGSVRAEAARNARAAIAKAKGTGQ